MKGSDWLLLAGVVVGGIVLVGYVRGHPAAIAAQQRQPPSKPPKPKLPRTIPPSAPKITPIAAVQPPGHNYGTCQCINGVLAGPECRAVGYGCADMANRIKAQTACSCDAGGNVTGAGCPYIGQSCLQLFGNLKYPAGNVPMAISPTQNV
jgi:hypothetical protein